MTDPLLLVDSRQPHWMGPHLGANGFDVHVDMLPAGDFAWTCPLGRVGLEDKPLAALLTDRRSGRLDDELRRLCDTYAVPILFVRGLPRVTKEGDLWFPPHVEKFYRGWTFTSLDDLLLGRQLRGVMIAWCPTDRGLGARLKALYEYTMHIPKDSPVRQAHFPWLGPLTGKTEVLYTILGLVENIRDRRALAERFAAEVPLSTFVAWGARDFRAAGFSKLMAERLAEKLKELSA